VTELATVAAHVEAMRRAYGEIESARTIDDVKDIRDRAEAARQYAKAAGYSREITNMCAEIKIRAERKAGTLLAEMPKAPGGQPYQNQSPPTGSTKQPVAPSYKDLGIEKTQAHRWQQSAAIPDDVVDAYIEDVKDAGEDVTSIGLRQFAARQRQPAPVNEPVPLPGGKFSCIVIDPPWPIQKIETLRRPDQGVRLDYPIMSLDDIAKIPVAEKSADDCHIYLWVTHKYLPAGLDLLEEWGFRYQCVMTWWKHTGVSPYSWMYDTEHVLFGHRGNLPLLKMGMRLHLDAPNVRGGHSTKPDVFYERVLAASPGPRLEMFARRERDGFTAWGNEVGDAR
jgi:N6-adenosine-specific RNA methylase IME4